MVVLLCTVRSCRRPLERIDRQLVCGNRHSFDLARSGYVNLLQPQDKRSSRPGDTADAVAARRRVLDAGHGDVFARAVAEMMSPQGPILDVGCGEGFHLDFLRRTLDVEAHGTDISTPAIDAAAKRYRECFFVVANADRFLPYADKSFGAITSITARINAAEFKRVLREEGQTLIAVAGPDDLIELRETILGERKLIDRVDRVVEEMNGFSLAEQKRLRHDVALSPAMIGDVMRSTYRGLRRSEQVRLDGIRAMRVTFSRDLLLFRRS